MDGNFENDYTQQGGQPTDGTQNVNNPAAANQSSASPENESSSYDYTNGYEVYQPPVYGDGSSYTGSNAYSQGNSYAQGNSYSQGNPYAQTNSYSQPNSYSQTNPYTQDGSSDQGNRQNGYASYQFQQPDMNQGMPPKKPDHKKKIGLIAALVGTFALVAVMVFLGVNLLGRIATVKNSTSAKPSTGEATESSSTDSKSAAIGSTEDQNKADESTDENSSANLGTDKGSTSGSLTIEQVSANAMPAMVAITTQTVEQVQNYFSGQTTQQQETAQGSGIIVGQSNDTILIATNNHVIADSNTISVAFVDNSVASGTVKGADADEDLAIVAVKVSDLSASTLKKIKVIEMGNSDECKVGEQVVAIGNALGYGQSVSSGIISALNREVTVDNVTHKLMQTDAAINPGNSGGALLNMQGQLIGINEVKYADTTVEGMGYAIPLSTASPILNNLMNKAQRQKVADANASYLGISCVSMPDSYVSAGYPAGVYVSSVVSGQAADKAGIKAGDIITAIDGNSVSTADALVSALEYYAAGETIDFSVSRLKSDQSAYESQKISVTLGAKADAPADTDSSSSTDSGSTSQNGQQGQQGNTTQPGGSQNGQQGSNGVFGGMFPGTGN